MNFAQLIKTHTPITSRFFSLAIVACSLSFAAQAQPLEISAAKELVWDQTKNLYEAIGDASATRGVQSISGDVLQAYYDNTSEDQNITRIIATRNVDFADADISGSGARLDYDVAQEFYRLDGPNAEIISSDGTAKAQSVMTYDGQKGIITADEKGEILLTDGRMLKGDMIEITLNETEEIQTIDAAGDVYVRQTDGKEAYAQTGTYDAKTDKAILTGDVKIIDGESILIGQKAEIDFNKGISRLLAEDGTGRVSGTLITSGN